MLKAYDVWIYATYTLRLRIQDQKYYYRKTYQQNTKHIVVFFPKRFHKILLNIMQIYYKKPFRRTNYYN